MKDVYDLTSIIDTTLFPWDEISLGIAKSAKKASIFYGHNHSIAGLTPEQQVWHKTITTGDSLKGLDILLTTANTWHDAWYKLGHEEHWTPTANIENFLLLQTWIKDSNIFKQVGRQIVFIQLQNSNTPKHVDQDLKNAPEEYRKNSEFIWITSPTMGKKLFVNEVQTAHIAWFNNYVEHYTLAESGLRWSIRLDGLFTDDFKEKLKLI
jgi:hypothetical protein